MSIASSTFQESGSGYLPDNLLWSTPQPVLSSSQVEGMLIYPPGQFGAKHLRMLTFIHGGLASADGDKFRADYYDWRFWQRAKAGWSSAQSSWFQRLQ